METNFYSNVKLMQRMRSAGYKEIPPIFRIKKTTLGPNNSKK